MLLVTVIDQSLSLVNAIQGWVEAGAPIPGWLAENRLLGPRIENLRAMELPGTQELGPQIVRVGRSLTRSVIAIAGGVAGNLFSFFATIVTLYVFYLRCSFSYWELPKLTLLSLRSNRKSTVT